MHRLHFLPLPVRHDPAGLGRGRRSSSSRAAPSSSACARPSAPSDCPCPSPSRMCAVAAGTVSQALRFVSCAQGVPAASRTTVPTAMCECCLHVFFLGETIEWLDGMCAVDYLPICLMPHATKPATTMTNSIVTDIPPYPPIPSMPQPPPFIMLPVWAIATPATDMGTAPTSNARRLFTLFASVKSIEMGRFGQRTEALQPTQFGARRLCGSERRSSRGSAALPSLLCTRALSIA